MTQGVHILTDNHKSFKKLLEVIEDHIAIQCFDKAASSELMPWVNIAISNAKRWILGIHHNVKPEYFQNYLNEFCYKFNRRYFDHMLMGKSSNSSNYYQVECIGLQTDSHKNMFGKLFGDRGYKSKTLADYHWNDGIHLIYKLRRNTA